VLAGSWRAQGGCRVRLVGGRRPGGRGPGRRHLRGGDRPAGRGALAAGVGWAIDHLGALKEWLQELTGNPGQVSGAAETWGSVAAYLEETAQELTQSVTGRLAAQHSMAVDAYKALQQDSADHLAMVAGLARAVGGGLKMASFLVNMVYEMVRDAISDVIGKLISKAAISAVTLGTATPACPHPEGRLPGRRPHPACQPPLPRGR